MPFDHLIFFYVVFLDNFFKFCVGDVPVELSKSIFDIFGSNLPGVVNIKSVEKCIQLFSCQKFRNVNRSSYEFRVADS